MIYFQLVFPYVMVAALALGIGFVAGNVAGRVQERRRRSRPAYTIDYNVGAR